MEEARRTEQERHEPLPELDRGDAEVERSGGGPESPPEDAERPTNQAIINQERALESGEENVV